VRGLLILTPPKKNPTHTHTLSLKHKRAMGDEDFKNGCVALGEVIRKGVFMIFTYPEF